MTSETDWTFVPAELDAFLSDKGHNALLGIRYHAHGPGWVELAMAWQEGLVGDEGEGSLASGPMMTLMDNAAGTSIYLRRGGYLPQVTLDLRVDYLRPTRRGADLICRTECISMSPTIAMTRGVAYEHSPDDPACHVTASFMLL
ncbi:MAG: PaaI family thioesterase [Novosphingobium sp.]|nr:PaaI family thioesterase [Novosphingobium sp.]